MSTLFMEDGTPRTTDHIETDFWKLWQFHLEASPTGDGQSPNAAGTARRRTPSACDGCPLVMTAEGQSKWL